MNMKNIWQNVYFKKIHIFNDFSMAKQLEIDQFTGIHWSHRVLTKYYDVVNDNEMTTGHWILILSKGAKKVRCPWSKPGCKVFSTWLLQWYQREREREG